MGRRTVAEWTAFVACIEAGGGLPRGIMAVGIQRRLLSLLRRPDVAELVTLYERTKSRYQARAAFHVLGELVHGRDKRLSPQTLERRRKAVIRRVRRGYPGEPGLHLWAGRAVSVVSERSASARLLVLQLASICADACATL